MKVLVINNDGGGFADYVEVPDGTTVRDMFTREVRTGKPDQYLIRVNRQPTASDQVLQAGDRISFTPVKIEGACRQCPPGEATAAGWSARQLGPDLRRFTS
jgi:hypothetical protein